MNQIVEISPISSNINNLSSIKQSNNEPSYQQQQEQVDDDCVSEVTIDTTIRENSPRLFHDWAEQMALLKVELANTKAELDRSEWKNALLTKSKQELEEEKELLLKENANLLAKLQATKKKCTLLEESHAEAAEKTRNIVKAMANCTDGQTEDNNASHGESTIGSWTNKDNVAMDSRKNVSESDDEVSFSGTLLQNRFKDLQEKEHLIMKERQMKALSTLKQHADRSCIDHSSHSAQDKKIEKIPSLAGSVVECKSQPASLPSSRRNSNIDSNERRTSWSSLELMNVQSCSFPGGKTSDAMSEDPEEAENVDIDILSSTPAGLVMEEISIEDAEIGTCRMGTEVAALKPTTNTKHSSNQTDTTVEDCSLILLNIDHPDYDDKDADDPFSTMYGKKTDKDEEDKDPVSSNSKDQSRWW
eukprot:CAMPEP_0178925366 /NCGR_PEP_ID=MMETSP0786-20121207/17872_1 /TAXON_ID=186022 /ORGANISM="Thalassionema frauenfeldii, Strain CCMP 1798" /LENGTH=416 /DNA_ID=CAMNT_0020600239 /DNA_START=109 /DNA_END=1356 /DNA_ORIENTATION=-